MIKVILTFSGILLAGLLMVMWLFFYSMIDIPRTIPHTSITIRGLFLLILFVLVLALAQKAIIRKEPHWSILRLSLSGGAICLISEGMYQIILKSIDGVYSLGSGIHYFLVSTIAMTVIGIAISFFAAFQIKTKKTGWLVLFIISFVFIVVEFSKIFPEKNW